MSPEPLPSGPRESARLRALREYGVLEAPKDPVLDGIVAMAARITGAPISLITLVTEDRVWLNATYGTTMTQLPREGSFCGRTIESPSDVLQVHDASVDPLFAQNPMVKGEPGVRSYTGLPLVTPSGFPIGTLCVADLTPRTLEPEQTRLLRMLAEQAIGHLEVRGRLRKSEQRFELIAHSAVDVIWDWDLEEDTLWWSETAEILFGHPAGTQREGQRSWKDLIHPDDRERISASVAEALQGRGDRWEESYRYQKADGTYTFIRDRAAILRNSEGNAIRMTGEMSDLTERRHSADLLALLSAAVDQSADLVMITDRTMTIQYVNAAFERHTGYAKKDVLGKSPRILKSGLHEREFYDRMTAQIEGGGVFAAEFTNRRKNGERYIESKLIAPIRNTEGEIIHFLSTGRDVTEQKRADEELRSKTAFFEAQLNSTISGIVLVEKAGSIAFVNRRFCEIWKILPGSLEGLDESAYLDRTSSLVKDPERYAQQNAHIRERPLQACRDEVELADGTTVDRYTSPVVGKDGRTYGRIWTYRDVTEQGRALRELAESLSLLDATLESTVDGILVVDGKGRLTKFNRKFSEMWKLPEEILNSRDDDRAIAFVLSQLKNPDGFTRKVRDLYAHPEADSFDVLEFKDGRVFERYSQPHRVGTSIVGRVWCFRDVTERRKLESRLLRTQRMESIGTLAGGIAHDLNNVLAPILISIDLLKAESGGDPEQLKVIEAIRVSANRGASLVRQVLTFARGLEGQRVAVDVRAIFADFESLVRETFPRNIRIVTEATRELSRLKGDPTQIHQVLLNLAVNARDAMPRGGVLSLVATNQTCDEESVRGHPQARPGKFVRIAVDDTGEGISPEIRDRVFEPFFTTKEVGKGTGLGLATVYAIVKSHGGFVTVSSNVGSGTTFFVHLPADGGMDSPELHPPAAPIAVVKGRGERVLVVDDEDSIRRVLTRVLERNGYSVVTASDGAQACEYYVSHVAEIALVLTDMMMPVMDGAATISAILSMNPSARIIASSGLNVAENTAKALSLGVRDFLPKPY